MIKNTSLITALLTGALACAGGSAASAQTTIPNLPDGHHDTLSISLAPAGGTVHGTAGSQVGWGFTVNWTSDAGDWIQITGTNLNGAVAPSNPQLVGNGGYFDYLGQFGGPYDMAVPPTYGPWTLPFISGAAGIGFYPIAADAVTGAADTGQIAITYQVYNGDPLAGGTRIGDGSYTYAGPDTAYTVIVDAPPTTAQQVGGLCTTVQSLPIAASLKTSLCATLQPRRDDDDDRGHRDGDSCDHDRRINGHRDGDGCDHDQKVKVMPVGAQCAFIANFVRAVTNTPASQLPAAFKAALLNQAATLQYAMSCKADSDGDGR